MLAALTLLTLTADPTLAVFDGLWPHRDDPKAAQQISELSKGFEATGDYARLWRAARWEAWLAGGTSGKEKQVFARAGWTLGERAQQADPAGLEGRYWTAINVGFWGASVGMLTAFAAGVEWRFRDPLLALTRADPDCQNQNLDLVGPESSLGHFFYKLPWPKQDKEKARDFLRRALSVHPEILRSHYLMADVLKDDDKVAARRELGVVLSGDENAFDPPDARRTKALARALLDRLK